MTSQHFTELLLHGRHSVIQCLTVDFVYMHKMNWILKTKQNFKIQVVSPDLNAPGVESLDYEKMKLERPKIREKSQKRYMQILIKFCLC